MTESISLTGFNGEFQDEVLHQYILGNGYRAYNPTLQRFTCPDSLSPFGNGGINPYAYCAGDPINNTDPTGHVFWEIILATGLMMVPDIAEAGADVAAVGVAEEVVDEGATTAVSEADQSISARNAERASQSVVKDEVKSASGKSNASFYDNTYQKKVSRSDGLDTIEKELDENNESAHYFERRDQLRQGHAPKTRDNKHFYSFERRDQLRQGHAPKTRDNKHFYSFERRDQLRQGHAPKTRDNKHFYSFERRDQLRQGYAPQHKHFVRSDEPLRCVIRRTPYSSLSNEMKMWMIKNDLLNYRLS